MTMKIIRLYFGIALVVLALLLSGCAKDFLDAYDQETITQGRLDGAAAASSQAGRNIIDAQLGGVYDILYTYTGQSRRDDFSHGLYFINLSLDVNGQDILFTGRAWGIYDYGRSMFNPTNSRPSQYWNKNYKMIGTINNILLSVPLNTDGTPSKLPEYYGVLRTLRGVSYYYLAGIFAEPYRDHNGNAPGVPLVLKAADAADSATGLRRVELSKVYEALIADLEAGVMYAPVKTTNPAQPSKLVALTFLAKAYMDMGEYAKALGYLNDLKDKCPTLNDLPDVRKFGFANVGEPSVLWGYDVTADNTLYYGSCSSIVDDTQDGYTSAAYYRIEPMLYKHMGDGDLRRIQFSPGGAERDPYLEKYFPGEELMSNSQLLGASMKFYGEKVFLGDPIWLRAADPALLRIECLIQTKDYSGARVAFKEFMATRDPDYVVPSEDTELLPELKLQRRIELWAEGGASWFDNRRWQDGLKRSSAHMNRMRDIPAGPSSFYTFPIPQSEIDKNPALQQNPIYKAQ
jgi:putative outer membrane protein, probably involved in nutrient binding